MTTTIKNGHGPADRSRINIHDEWEMGWWCSQLDCSKEQLNAATRAVGLGVANVQKFLNSSFRNDEDSSDKDIELLLAEDNPLDAELTLRSLKKGKLFNPVHWVKDGQEALDFLFCRGSYANRAGMPPPKLILLDIQMPKMNGLEVLQKIKAAPSLRSIPVVIMTLIFRTT